MRLFHLLAAAEWEAAKCAGVYAPRSLELEGFIHLSLDRQLLRSAEKYFAGRNDVVVLALDATKLTAAVKLEHVAMAKDSFPHLYGPLNLSAVIDAEPLHRGGDGKFCPPACLPR